jgi:predicted Zn-dependent protease
VAQHRRIAFGLDVSFQQVVHPASTGNADVVETSVIRRTNGGLARGTEKLHEAEDKVAAARRVGIEAAFKRMKADASEAEARMQKLKWAGSESWSSWSAALAESHKAFDRANQAAWGAVKRAASPKS